MTKGYIYIMTNPALKDMVKIGYPNDDMREKINRFWTGLSAWMNQQDID